METEDGTNPEFEAWVLARADEHAGRHFYTTVAGVTFPNDDGSDRQALLAACRPRDPLALVPEPDNPFHAQAVKVMTCPADGGPAHQLGYLDRRRAQEISGHLKCGEHFAAAVCERREAGHRLDEHGHPVPVHGLVIVVFHRKKVAAQ